MIANEMFARLAQVRVHCPDMRIGQYLSTIGRLGEDATGRALWEIEDEDFVAAVERFASDLTNR